jgi:MoaD family protein
MKVKIKFFTTLREITGKKEEQLELPENATLENALDELSRKYGTEFIDYLFEKGKIRSYLQILIDGKNLNQLQGKKTKLNDGCTIAILPPAGGG